MAGALQTQIDPGSAELSWGTVSIQNDEGLYQDPCFIELDGKDAYEGLSAVLVEHERLEIDGDGDDEVRVVDGLIFPGNLPPDR